MANEIKLVIKATVDNGGFSDRFETGQLLIDQAAQGYHGQIVNLGTSEASISVGAVGTEGYIFMRNLDATGVITFGPDDGAGAMVAMGQLKPGEACCFRMSGATLFWISDTAATQVEYRIYED